MRIKNTPEDFWVEEIPARAFSEHGALFVYRATKRDRTTNDMITILSQLNNVQPRDIRFAGLKDKRAITTQYLTSAKPLTKTSEHIVLEPAGKTDEHLHLGDLKANAFRIEVQDITHIHNVAIPNYFGDQRFSKENVELGLKLLKGQFFEVAHHLAKEHPGVRQRLETHPDGSVQALQVFPFRILLLYVHAVQSWLFNEAVSAWVKEKDPDAREVEYRHGILRYPQTIPDIQVPVVGAVQELGEWEQYYAPLLAKAGLTQQSFLVRAFPSLTQEGELRALKADIKEQRITQEGSRATIELVLGPGCYATVCIQGWCS